MRKKLIFWVTFVGGLYFFLEFMLPVHLPWTKTVGWYYKQALGWKVFSTDGIVLGAYHEEISNGAILTGIMALGLGLINIMRLHGVRVAKLRKGWIHSTALIFGMLATIVLGFWHWGDPEAVAGKLYGDVIMGTKGLFPGLSSAMFSLLAFYVATAAYRAFRIKSGEAALLMFSALLVMLGQIPHGVVVFDFAMKHTIIVPSKFWFGWNLPFSITDIRMWILLKLNVGAFRAISLGFGVAGLAMATRMWLSMGMGFFREEEDS